MILASRYAEVLLTFMNRLIMSCVSVTQEAAYIGCGFSSTNNRILVAVCGNYQYYEPSGPINNNINI